MTTSTSGRFDTLFKKIKEKPGEKVDDFDATLEDDRPKPQPQVPVKKRKRGKKGNPDYTQTTAYVRLKVYNETVKRLIDEGRVRDYSDLVNDLLTSWLKKS